jgi:hypothetical protein
MMRIKSGDSVKEKPPSLEIGSIKSMDNCRIMRKRKRQFVTKRMKQIEIFDHNKMARGSLPPLVAIIKK